VSRGRAQWRVGCNRLQVGLRESSIQQLLSGERGRGERKLGLGLGWYILIGIAYIHNPAQPLGSIHIAHGPNTLQQYF
jgi:hypothetical protein